MASSATAGGKKIEWLVVVPDFEGVGEKRLEVRPYVYFYTFIASNYTVVRLTFW